MTVMTTYEHVIQSRLKKKNLSRHGCVSHLWHSPTATLSLLVYQPSEKTRTRLELGVVVCASNQLKGLLKPHGVLGGAVQGLDAADEGGHLPFGLAGGWRQERLIALVKGAGPDSVCHGQHRDLEGRRRKLVILPWKGGFCSFVCF